MSGYTILAGIGEHTALAVTVIGMPGVVIPDPSPIAPSVISGYTQCWAAAAHTDQLIAVARDNFNQGNGLSVYDGDFALISGTPSIDSATCAVFSDDDALLAVLDQGTDIVICSTATWAQSASIGDNGFVAKSLAFSPSGTMIAVACAYIGEAFNIFNTTTGAAISGGPTPPNANGLCVAFSPDGTLFAAGSSSAPYIQVYSTATWALTASQPVATGNVASLAFSPDSTQLAAVVGNGLAVWETAGWTAILGTPVMSGDYPQHVNYAPGGTQLIVCCNSNNDDHGIMVYDTTAWTADLEMPKPASGRYLNTGIAPWLLPSTVSGTIYDAAGAPCARTVHLLRRDNLSVLASATSDASSGDYELSTYYTGECLRLALDSTGNYNDRVQRVFPA